jgi:CRISPR-associated protein Cmr3
MRAAIKLVRWFIGQVKLLYGSLETTDGALEPVYTKLIQLSRVRGWLRAKDVRNYERSLRKASSEIIRAHFRELEAMGYGETCGMGNRLQWRATVDRVDGIVDGVSTAEMTDMTGL